MTSLPKWKSILIIVSSYITLNNVIIQICKYSFHPHHISSSFCLGNIILHVRRFFFFLRKDSFKVICGTYLGRLTRIRIGHDNSGLGPGWFLNKVCSSTSKLSVHTQTPTAHWRIPYTCAQAYHYRKPIAIKELFMVITFPGFISMAY